MSGLSTEVKKELYELYKYYHQQQHDSDSDDVDTPSKVVRTDESEFYPNSDTGIILEANYKGIIVGLKVEYDKIFKRFNVEGFDEIDFFNFSTPTIQIVKERIDKFFREANENKGINSQF